MHTDIAPILAAHPGLLHRMRFLRMRFQLRSCAEVLQVEIDGAGLKATRLAEAASAACDFSLAADATAWAEFAQPLPAPGYQDIVAMIESGHARFEGDGLVFHRNLFLVKGIAAAVFRGDASW